MPKKFRLFSSRGRVVIVWCLHACGINTSKYRYMNVSCNNSGSLHLHACTPYSSLFQFISHPVPMDIFNWHRELTGHSGVPNDPPALRLDCPAPACGKPICWDQILLTPSKKIYGCPHCEAVFCLICKEPPSTNSVHEYTSECLLNSTAPGVLLCLLLFHEALLELKGLSRTREKFASFPRDGMSGAGVGILGDVIGRAEDIMGDAEKATGDLYTMLVAKALGN